MASNEEYEINIETEDQTFPYSTCVVQNVFLKKHYELPQNLTFISPKQSPNEKYVGIIGKGTNSDTLFIWSKENLNKPKLIIKGAPINCYEFANNELSVVIIYKTEDPVHYSLSQGKLICKFEHSSITAHRSLGSSFTAKSRYFALASEAGLIVWDVLNGKMIKSINDNSPSKFLRKNLLISISENGKIKVIELSSGKIVNEFKLMDVSKNTDILTCMLNEDIQYFYYATKKGFFCANIINKEIQLVQGFPEDDTEQVIISQDCISAVSTNMKEISYWKLGEGKIGTFFKENFTSLNVDFHNNKLITSNKICINIWDYSTEEDSEQFIWLNKNPDVFENFYFSPDFSVLLVIVDENNAVLYDSLTGNVLKKWYCNETNWSYSCLMAPATSLTAILAVKVGKDKIRVCDYNNGSELMTLIGFNAYSLAFSSGGNLLAAGCIEGDEIGRIWDLTTGNYNSLMNNNYDNKNTMIYLTQEEPTKAIVVPEKQTPIVYDIESGNVLYRCSSCSTLFNKVDVINSSSNNLFYIHGLSTNNENIAVLFDLDNGDIIREFKNCINIDLSKDGKYLLAKSDSDNEGKLTIFDIENRRNIRNYVSEVNSNLSTFLQGGKSIVSGYGTPDKITYILTNPQTGKLMGMLTYKKKVDLYSEVDLSAEPEENRLVLRYIKLCEQE